MPARKLPAAEPSARDLAHSGTVLVDSGPLIALFNGADRWHAPVRDWLRGNPRAVLHSTWPVATEARLKIRHLLSLDADVDVHRDRAGRPLVNLLRG